MGPASKTMQLSPADLVTYRNVEPDWSAANYRNVKLLLYSHHSVSPAFLAANVLTHPWPVFSTPMKDDSLCLQEPPTEYSSEMAQRLISRR